MEYSWGEASLTIESLLKVCISRESRSPRGPFCGNRWHRCPQSQHLYHSSARPTELFISQPNYLWQVKRRLFLSFFLGPFVSFLAVSLPDVGHSSPQFFRLCLLVFLISGFWVRWPTWSPWKDAVWQNVFWHFVSSDMLALLQTHLSGSSWHVTYAWSPFVSPPIFFSNGHHARYGEATQRMKVLFSKV